jgi:hypothetical protein
LTHFPLAPRDAPQGTAAEREQPQKTSARAFCRSKEARLPHFLPSINGLALKRSRALAHFLGASVSTKKQKQAAENRETTARTTRAFAFALRRRFHPRGGNAHGSAFPRAECTAKVAKSKRADVSAAQLRVSHAYRTNASFLCLTAGCGQCRIDCHAPLPRFGGNKQRG